MISWKNNLDTSYQSCCCFECYIYNASVLQSQSPDFQMEELLTRDGSAKDEVSEKYLSINSRYITDGQVSNSKYYIDVFEVDIHSVLRFLC